MASRMMQVAVAMVAFGFAWVLLPHNATAHPHVFIDGDVDFIVDDHGALTGLSITWRYDPFESLYALSRIGIVPEEDGTLTPEDRATLIRNESDWPEDFEGAAHLSIDGVSVPLSRPIEMDADLEDGRLVVRFRRDLADPVPLNALRMIVALYERTYFYAFSVGDEPKIIGGGENCRIGVARFDSSGKYKALLTTLAALSREEVPEDTNIGANFADRIILKCA